MTLSLTPTNQISSLGRHLVQWPHNNKTALLDAALPTNPKLFGLVRVHCIRCDPAGTNTLGSPLPLETSATPQVVKGEIMYSSAYYILFNAGGLHYNKAAVSLLAAPQSGMMILNVVSRVCWLQTQACKLVSWHKNSGMPSIKPELVTTMHKLWWQWNTATQKENTVLLMWKSIGIFKIRTRFPWKLHK